MVLDMTVRGMTFGCCWTFTYRNLVHRRRFIAADEIENSWQIFMTSRPFARVHILCFSHKSCVSCHAQRFIQQF